MGQQQLLLIILGVIVVGIAVAVGITMFTDSAVSANRDAVTNDLVNLAARAQQFYRRPTALGGGGNSYVGLTANAAGLAKLTNRSSNANGTYSIVTAGTSNRLVIQGVGTELAGGNLVTMRIIVKSTDADSVTTVY